MLLSLEGFALSQSSRTAREAASLGSEEAARLPESPALRFLAAKASLPFLLLLKRSEASDAPLCFQAGLDFLSERPAELLRDALKALGSGEALTLAIQKKSERRPLALLAKQAAVRQLFVLPLPKVEGQIRGCLLGGLPADEEASPAKAKWLLSVLSGLGTPQRAEEAAALREESAFAGWIGAEIACREAEIQRDSRGAALLTLAEAIRELCRSWEPEAMLRTILSLSVRLIAPAQCGTLFLLEDGFLRVKETEGFPVDVFRGLRISPGESLPGKVLSSRKPIRLVSQAAVLATAANYSPENKRVFADGFRGLGMPRSAIAAPLLVREEPIGVILLDSFSDERAFSDPDLELLQQFANLSSVVIETSRSSGLAQLRAFLLDRVQDAVVVFDEEGRIRSHNAGAQGLWIWPQPPAGKLFTDLFDPPSRREAERAVMEATRTGHGSVELEARAADGTKRPLLASISILRTQKETSFVAIFADLTERNRMQRMLLQSARMESVAALAGGLAHDFNNLLGVIHGYAAFLRQRLAGNREGLEELGGLESAASRAAELTARLVAVGQGRRHLDFRAVRVGRLVRETLALLQKTLGERTAVEFAGPQDEMEVRADPLAIQEILVNLALNARDAMPNGGRFRIEVRALDADAVQPPPGAQASARWIRLETSDTGRGMSPEVLARIYEPFFTTKENAEGAGLGCTMVYSIARAHGGWIEAESAPSLGSTFRIYLPAP